MRILIVGKQNIMRWPEQTANAMRKLAPMDLFLFNRRTIGYCLSKIGGKYLKNFYLKYAFNRKIKQFKPDAVLFVWAFFTPTALLEVMKRYPHIKTIGWQGDAFGSRERTKGDMLDILFCTDTGFMPAAESFRCQTEYLPLCADETIFQNQNLPKTVPPFFVGVANPKRTTYLAACRQKCLVYGKGWDTAKLAQHEVHNETIAHDKLNDFIGRTIAPLNLAFSVNNINGLNFRPFEIGAAGGLIMTNACPDLALCYDVGKEAVAYHSPSDFADLIDDIVAHPEKYDRIAKAGYERTLKDHTYTNRCQTILDKIHALSK